MKLTPQQIEHYLKAQIENGVPCRFLHNGQCLNIVTGRLQPRGINIMHQRVYWNFSKETAREIAKLLGCKVKFM